MGEAHVGSEWPPQKLKYKVGAVGVPALQLNAVIGMPTSDPRLMLERSGEQTRPQRLVHATRCGISDYHNALCAAQNGLGRQAQLTVARLARV